MQKALVGLAGLALMASCRRQDTSPDAQPAANPRTCVNFLNNPKRIDKFFNPCLGYKKIPASGFMGTALDIYSDDSIALLVVSENNGSPWRIYRYSEDGRTQLWVSPLQGDISGELMALQSDGKAIWVSSDTTGFWRLKRFNSDGSLDTTFVADGLSGIVSSKANAIVIQPDNKILVAGSIYPEQLSVLRYTQDGQLDPSFGSGGYLGLGLKEARAMVLQGDGKIVLSFLDQNNIGPASELGLLRLNPDGTLDSGFGIGGLVEDTRQIFGDANHLALQADGKIVIASHTQRDITPNYLLRFEASGAVDTSFGHSGEAAAGHYPPLGLVIQSDGIIVVQSSSLMYRFFPNGSDAGGYRDLAGIIPADVSSLGMVKKLPDGRLMQSMSGSSNNGPFFPYLLRLLP